MVDKDIVPRETLDYEPIKSEVMMSDIFAQSGMFKDIKSKAQALVKILAGKELGISPFESMASLYIVNDKLALTSKAMSTLIKKSPNYDYKIDKLDDSECVLTFIEAIGDKETELGKSKFDLKDAAKCGLINKETFKSYPRNMLFARALSNGARWYVPHLISGYYTVEELDDTPYVATTTTIEMSDEEGIKNANV